MDKKKTKKQIESKELKIIRWNGADFIQKMGHLLDVCQSVIAIAIIYFQKFYNNFSFQKYEKSIIGASCLFISCKNFEKHRRMRDVINVMMKVKYPDRKELGIISSEYFVQKERIKEHEQIVLRALKYDLNANLPYAYLLNYSRLLSLYKNKLSDIYNLNKLAWTILNDCLRTSILLEHKAEDVTVAAMYISMRLSKIKLKPKNWYSFHFEVEKKTIDLVASKIFEMYENPVVENVKKDDKDTKKRKIKRPKLSFDV